MFSPGMSIREPRRPCTYVARYAFIAEDGKNLDPVPPIKFDFSCGQTAITKP